jgi:ribosomal protein L7/L12
MRSICASLIALACLLLLATSCRRAETTTATPSAPPAAATKPAATQPPAAEPPWKAAFTALRGVEDVSLPIESKQTMLALQQAAAAKGGDGLKVGDLRPAFTYEPVDIDNLQTLARPAYTVRSGKPGMNMTIPLMEFLQSAVDDPQADAVVFNPGVAQAPFRAVLGKADTRQLLAALVQSGRPAMTPRWNTGSKPAGAQAETAATARDPNRPAPFVPPATAPRGTLRVTLVDLGKEQVGLSRTLQILFHCDYPTARRYMDAIPVVLRENCTQAQADKWRGEIESAGGKATVDAMP